MTNRSVLHGPTPDRLLSDKGEYMIVSKHEAAMEVRLVGRHKITQSYRVPAVEVTMPG
jgi:hypothetical protein